MPLFDAYRQFYRQPSDPERARDFLRERFERQQSVIYLSYEGDVTTGFTQLYPSFSSGSLARIFILNDLFVTPEARTRNGNRTTKRRRRPWTARRCAAACVIDRSGNREAQCVYERLGWKRDTAFFVYQLAL